MHGEAVAAGMVLASRLSTLVSDLPRDDAMRVEALVSKANLPIAPPNLAIDRWLDLMSRDKKVEDSVIRFVLLSSLGRAIVHPGVSREALASVLR